MWLRLLMYLLLHIVYIVFVIVLFENGEYVHQQAVDGSYLHVFVYMYTCTPDGPFSSHSNFHA